MLKQINTETNGYNRLPYVQIPQEIFYLSKYPLLAKLINASPKNFMIRYSPFLASHLLRLRISDRAMEYPFVHQNLGLNGEGRILDAGCSGSKLAIELACLGYQVYGADLDLYPIKHRNFNFVRSDICRLPFPDGFFDAVVTVSTIEHIGLGTYFEVFGLAEQQKAARTGADRLAIEEIARVVKKEGRIIITVPFGKEAVFYYKKRPQHRVYNWAMLQETLSPLDIVKKQFLMQKGRDWVPASVSEVEDVNGETTELKGLALIVASKKPEETRHLSSQNKTEDNA